MPTWGWVLIAVLAVIAVAAIIVAARATAGHRRTAHLKQHFGPEYERLVGPLPSRSTPACGSRLSRCRRSCSRSR